MRTPLLRYLPAAGLLAAALAAGCSRQPAGRAPAANRPAAAQPVTTPAATSSTPAGTQPAPAAVTAQQQHTPAAVRPEAPPPPPAWPAPQKVKAAGRHLPVARKGRPHETAEHLVRRAYPGSAIRPDPENTGADGGVVSFLVTEPSGKVVRAVCQFTFDPGQEDLPRSERTGHYELTQEGVSRRR